MGREYRHSVKESLTRKLVLIIIISVVVIYALVITIQTIASTSQRDDTETYVQALQINNFQGQLQSRAGQIGQKLQMHVNFMINLHKNFKLVYDGSIPQAQTSYDERDFYYNRQLYELSPETY